MSDPKYPAGDPAPLVPDREYDMPSGRHVGRGAALRVPVSEGPASLELDRTDVDETTLIESEPTLEPPRQMEVGTEWTDEAERRVHELDRPVHPTDA